MNRATGTPMLRMDQTLRTVPGRELRILLALAEARCEDPMRDLADRENYEALADVYRVELRVRSATRLPWLGAAHRDLMRSVAA